ncbi:MAG: PAS domain-containing sensor histidine kinase [Acidobacteria bacterium]|nr:MAG: PAS domain-containing sensor histidine kinase [Acidobacteriota bacterium]
MTLRARLLLSQVPLVMAVLALGGVALQTLRSLGTASQDILKDNYRSVLAAQRMKEAAERIDSAALFIVAGQEEKAVEQIASNRGTFESELRVEEGNITEPGEQEAADELRRRWDEYQMKVQAFVRLTPDEARVAYFRDLEPAFLAVKAAANRILDMNQQAMVLKSERVQAVARRLQVATLLSALAALAVGALTTSRAITRALRPMAVLTHAVRRIGQKDFAARAKVAGTDEIAALATDFNAMAERLAEFEQSSLGAVVQARQASHAAIESLPDPVVVFDSAGKILAANQAARTLLRLPADEQAARLGDVDPAPRAAIERARAHVLAGRGAYVPQGYEEAVRLSVGGAQRQFLPRGSALYEAGGAIAGVAVTLQDVTRLRHFDELKTDLVATVAHEFRTPLTSLRMAVHLMLEQAAGPLTDKQAELLYAAREDCERMQTMVDDLLDLSRIEGGVLDVRPQATEVAPLVDHAVEAERAAAAEAKVDLRTEVPPGLPAVAADRERIHLVLVNLISNAIRHTPAGGSVRVAAAEDGGGRVKVRVSDTGTGIAREFQPRIFEKFFRLPDADAGGAGLGLFIARETVRAHRGDIGVESSPGQGTTIWFSLPAVEAGDQHLSGLA